VVDDHPTNREFLVTQLGIEDTTCYKPLTGQRRYKWHGPSIRPHYQPYPHADYGRDGLVRQLRADPDLGHLPVIFSTAHYLDQEASALAHQYGVPFILPKTLRSLKTVLALVDAALGLTSSFSPPPVEEVFDHEHLRLMTNQLAHKAWQSRRG